MIHSIFLTIEKIRRGVAITNFTEIHKVLRTDTIPTEYQNRKQCCTKVLLQDANGSNTQKYVISNESYRSKDMSNT